VTNSFLKAVLEKTRSTNYTLSEICFILPSQRAGTEMKHLIANQNSHTFRLPVTTTLNKWKEEISELFPAEKSELYLYLYQAYKNALGVRASSFEKFLAWADILLSDLNDIDNQLLESKQVFKDLRSYAEIEHFSFLQDELSAKQKNYRQFWVSLGKIYEHFTKTLLQNQLGHSGLIGRTAFQNTDKFLRSNDAYYVVAGFNALSKSEQKILEKVLESNCGKLFFDVDSIYLQNKHLKAGSFIRKFNSASFGEVIESDDSLAKKDLSVRIIHCPSAEIQAKTIVEEIEKLTPEQQKETAVILPDEDFLIQFLNVFPKNVIDANITMGISIRNSTFFSWLEILLDESVDHMKTLENHPFLATMNRFDGFYESQFVNLIRGPITSTSQLEKLIVALVDLLKSDQSKDLLTKQALAGSYEILKVLNQIHLQGGSDLSAYRKLIINQVGQVSINIISQPDKRLQVMGLLESRGLGFRNVIVCSAMEDYLPGQLNSDSFIPFEIRKHHGLPGNYLKEAAFSYNFYRLTHDAAALTLIYYDKVNKLSESEKSRYINQMVYDLGPDNQNISIKHISKKTPIPQSDPPLSEIKKTPEVIKEIKKYLERGVSASSINRYFDDPLEWYFGYVLKLDEPERDVLDVAGFGTIVHKCLEKLYQPYKRELISEEILKLMKSKTLSVLEEIFREQASVKSLEKGEVRVSLEMASKMVHNYLQSEIIQIERTGKKLFIDGERWLGREAEFDVYGDKIRVKFVGQADKIEEYDNSVFIVDYKTGRVGPNELTVEKWDSDLIRKKPKSIQLFLYQYMAKLDWPDRETLGQIVSLPAPSKRKLFAQVKDTKGFDEAAFEEILQEIFCEMLNPDIALEKNMDFKYAVFEA